MLLQLSYVDLIGLLAFYVFQFHDYFTTSLNMRLVGEEQEVNLLIRPIAKNPILFSLYKFGLASLIPLASLLVLHSSWPIYIDTLIEGIVTWINIRTLALVKYSLQSS